jgi:hypothetical protein
MNYTIVAVSDQPELAPMVATWLLDEFRHPGFPTHEGLTARILAPRTGLEETFVLFEGDIPVATASLARKDLDSRPDLTPWFKKNPFMSLWLNGANTAAGRAPRAG